MLAASAKDALYQKPVLITQAQELARCVQSLPPAQLAKTMHLSPVLATKTHKLLSEWNVKPSQQISAIDAFLGDIYSGLQVQTFSESDRAYANQHLYILSGLYGVLRGLDGISPYRLEMGYRLPNEPYKNLYRFWGERVVKCLPPGGTIVDLAAIEYSKAVLPFIG